MNFDDELMRNKWKKILPTSKSHSKDSNVAKGCTVKNISA